MAINLDYKKDRVRASYKSIYLKDELIEKIEKIAEENNSSFNNIVVNMLEYCVNEKTN